MNPAILAIEYHLPARLETNEDLQRENPDWRVDEVYAKSGIAARPVAATGETASDLGYQAARKLLDRGLVAPEQIDYLLYCTQAPDYFLPSGACTLQDRLQLGKHVGALDFNLGCSGFVYGLQMAKALIASGMARYVLLITAETYTKFIHPRDRTVRMLFGDGAAATLIGASESPGAIGQFVVGSDGSGAESLIVRAGGMRLPRSAETARECTDDAQCTRSQNHLYMDGAAVFSFAISTVPRVVASLLESAGWTAESVDWYVYHQANKYMLEHLARRSKIPQEKMVVRLRDVGNTVSASIPIALRMHLDAGELRSGARLVLVGFGVGYSWAACTLVWG